MPNLNLKYAPLDKLVVTSESGKRISPTTGQDATHRGMDFQAQTPTNLYNSHDGKVIVAENSPTYGKVVVIRDNNSGYSTLYAHLSEINTDSISVGKNISGRTLLGKTGNTGPKTTQYHLHFEVIGPEVSDLIEGNGISAAFGQPRLNPRTYIANSPFAAMLSTEVHSGELGYGIREGDQRDNVMIRDAVGLYDADQMIFSGLEGDDEYKLKLTYTGKRKTKILDRDGKPVLDANGKPTFKTETHIVQSKDAIDDLDKDGKIVINGIEIRGNASSLFNQKTGEVIPDEWGLKDLGFNLKKVVGENGQSDLTIYKSGTSFSENSAKVVIKDYPFDDQHKKDAFGINNLL